MEKDNILVKGSISNPSTKLRVNDKYRLTIFKNNICTEDFYIRKERLNLLDEILKTIIKEDKSSNVFIEYMGRRETDNEKTHFIFDYLREVSFNDFITVINDFKVNTYLDVIDDKKEKINLPKDVRNMLSYSVFGFNLTYEDKVFRFLGQIKILDKFKKLKLESLIPLFEYKEANINYYINYDYVNSNYVLYSNKLLLSSINLEDIFKYFNEEKSDNYSYPLNLYNSLISTFNNHKIKLNNISKLYIKHTPYVEFKEGKVLTIPSVEYETVALVNSKRFRLGGAKFLIKDINDIGVSFKVEEATNMLINERPLTKNEIINLKFEENKSLRIVSDKGKENWDIKASKASFKKEYRRIEYGKIINILESLPIYKELCDIEKYETAKSLMLFLYFIGIRDDDDTLKEFYKVLYNNSELYEEFISKYNIEVVERIKTFDDFLAKKVYKEKLSFVESLVDANYLTYPHFIFSTFDFFERDKLMHDFSNEIKELITKDSFKEYLEKLFVTNGLYRNLNDEDKKSFKNSLTLLSLKYFEDTLRGENWKYYLEREVLKGVSEDDLSYAIITLLSNDMEENERYRYLEVAQKKYLEGVLKVPFSYKEVK